MGCHLVMVLMALMIPGGRSWAPFKGVHLNRLIKTYSEKMPGQLAEMYLDIKAAKKDQAKTYRKWLRKIDTESYVTKAASVGLNVNVTNGHISYKPNFDLLKPKLSYDLLYVRHGKTEGNTEPRVYQGYVDEPWNQLTDVGIEQAKQAADKMDELKLSPDLVILSPLTRVKDTAKPYLSRHPELEKITEIWEKSHEMSFGDWENCHVKDIDPFDICHLFYLEQNAMVHADAVSNVNPNTPIENFIDVLVRMSGVLKDIEARMSPLAAERKAANQKPPLVLMYGHSMAGAALAILNGNGLNVDGGNNLGFDGKYILPNATPVYLHRVDKPAP